MSRCEINVLIRLRCLEEGNSALDDIINRRFQCFLKWHHAIAERDRSSEHCRCSFLWRSNAFKNVLWQWEKVACLVFWHSHKHPMVRASHPLALPAFQVRSLLLSAHVALVSTSKASACGSGLFLARCKLSHKGFRFLMEFFFQWMIRLGNNVINIKGVDIQERTHRKAHTTSH